MSLLNILSRITPRRFHHFADSFYYGFITDIQRVLLHNKNAFTTVEIETTTTCNKACPSCPTATNSRPQALMEERLFYKIIDELEEMGFKGRISPHFYGEPLTDNRLSMLMSYVRTEIPDSEIVVWTNGELLNKVLLAELIQSGVDLFIVSQYNGDDLPLLKELSSKERKHVYYREISDEHYLFNRGGLVKPKNERRFNHCHHPSSAVVIDYQGNVVLCCNDYHSSITFGNLQHEKLKSIWEKGDYRLIRKNTRRGIFDLSICKVCSGNP